MLYFYILEYTIEEIVVLKPIFKSYKFFKFAILIFCILLKRFFYIINQSTYQILYSNKMHKDFIFNYIYI